MTSALDPLPATLRWAVLLLYVEAGATAALAAFLIYEDLTGEASSLAAALALTGMVALCAAALGGLAWALSRRRSAARGPAIFVQLLLLPVAYFLIVTGQPVVGLLVGALAIAVGALLLTGASRAALGIG